MLSSIVNKDVKMNRKPQLKIIDIEDIKENKLNIFLQKDIEELAENINMNGLLKPLEVYYDENEEMYILLGGHRRFKALNLLYNQDLIDPEISCLVYIKPQNQIDERMQIITSNAQRDLDEQQKIEITKELLSILKEDPSRKPKNMPTVNWLAPYIGCSPRTAQKYKNKAEGKIQNKKSTSAKKERDKLTELIKLSENYNKSLNKIYWDLTQEEKEIILEHTENSDIKLSRVIEKLTALTDHLVLKLSQKKNT